MVHNIGIYDGPKGMSINNIHYNIWTNMLERCYSKKYHSRQPTYTNATICDEWKFYSNFEKWSIANYKNNFALDKDLLSKNNKIYSPETCCYLPRVINQLISSTNKNTNLLFGVSKNRNIYRARIRKYGELINLGSYYTQEEAHKAWQYEKTLYIRDVIEIFKNDLPIHVQNELANIANLIEFEMKENKITTVILK